MSAAGFVPSRCRFHRGRGTPAIAPAGEGSRTTARALRRALPGPAPSERHGRDLPANPRARCFRIKVAKIRILFEGLRPWNRTRSCLINSRAFPGASELRERATRPERAGAAARESACRGVRGAKPLITSGRRRSDVSPEMRHGGLLVTWLEAALRLSCDEISDGASPAHFECRAGVRPELDACVARHQDHHYGHETGGRQPRVARGPRRHADPGGFTARHSPDGSVVRGGLAFVKASSAKRSTRHYQMPHGKRHDHHVRGREQTLRSRTPPARSWTSSSARTTMGRHSAIDSPRRMRPGEPSSRKRPGSTCRPGRPAG